MGGTALIVRCPAKINTFLSVGPPDSSGFHPIRTVFQAIGLFDEIEVSVSDLDSVVWVGAKVPEENTVSKVLRLSRECAPIPPLAIVVHKQIPVQAGLGGGSSNAAGLLRYIKRSWPDFMSERSAFEIACAVGADVSFFLTGGRVRGTGYGETLESLPDKAREWLVVAKPEIGVSTASAFARLDDAKRPFKEFSDEAFNDFERVAPCECLELVERLRTLGAKNALLCGSGSAVFGSFSDESKAKAAAEQMAEIATWVAPTLTREESLWMS